MSGVPKICRSALSITVFAGLLLFIAQFSFGQTTIASGNWSNTAVWPGGIILPSTANIVIGTGLALTVDGNRTCNSMTVGTGSTLSVDNGIILTVTNGLIFPNLPTANSTGFLTGPGTINAGSCNVGGSINPTADGLSTIVTFNIG